MNHLKPLIFLLPGVILLLAGGVVLFNPEVAFPGAEARLRDEKDKLVRVTESIRKGKLENQHLLDGLKTMTQIRRSAIPITADGSLFLRERLDGAATSVHPCAEVSDLALELIKPLDGLDLIGVKLLHEVAGLPLNEDARLVVVVCRRERDLLELGLCGLVVNGSENEVLRRHIRGRTVAAEASEAAAHHAEQNEKGENPEHATAETADAVTTNRHNGGDRTVHCLLSFQSIYPPSFARRTPDEYI